MTKMREQLNLLIFSHRFMNHRQPINTYFLFRLENHGRLGAEGCLLHFGFRNASELRVDTVFCPWLTLRLVCIINQRGYYLTNIKES